MSVRTPSRSEYVADACVHVVGITAGIVGAAVLVVMGATQDSPQFAALLTYSVGLLAMLGCSAAYNMSRSSESRDLLRCLDNSAIFLMIAGTYTPFTALRLHDTWALGMTSLVWAIAVGGITLRVLRPQVFSRCSIALYLTLGWTAVIGFEPLLNSLQSSTFLLLGIGGLIYTVGIIFHLWERLPFQNAVWHGMVLAAASVHYAAILDEVAFLPAT